MTHSERTEKILNGNLYKTIIFMAFPIMINNLIQTLYNVIDGIWVSKLGSVQFAATSFVWPVNSLFVAIGFGLSIAGTSIIARLIGANLLDEVKKYATQLVVLSFLTSIVLTIIAFFVAPYIVTLMGGTGQLGIYANQYLQVTILGIPFIFLYSILSGFLRAEGNNILPTILGVISAFLNIILDPIFIFTFDMGIIGAAIATLISQGFLVIASAVIFLKGKNLVKLDFRNFRFNKAIIYESVAIALPSTIGQTGASFGFMILNGFVASYGTSVLAAFGMVNRITGLIMQPAMGIGAAIIAIIGQNLGAKQIDRAKETFKKAMIITSIIGTVGTIVLLVFDQAIIDFFMQSKDDISVISHGITFLHYISFSMPLMGIFSVLQGVFQGSSYTKYSMAMEIGRLWFIRIPMILFFKNFTDIGAIGIWFSMSFSNLLIDIFGYLLYKFGKWNKVLKTQEKVA